MKTFGHCKIEKDNIAIIASGDSVLELSDEDLTKIKDSCFTIFINYAPSKFKPEHIDLLMWSDKRVSVWLMELFKENKPYHFLSRRNAFYGWDLGQSKPNKPANNSWWLAQNVDYWFEQKQEQMFGNYTIVWLLLLILKYHSNKNVYIFGLDMEYKDERYNKWYDRYTDYDKKKRNYEYNKKLTQCAEHLNKFILNKYDTSKIFNCNEKSSYDGFKKIDWKNNL